MFCPKCGAEYRAGIARCADCDVELVGQAPEDPVAAGRPPDPDAHIELVVVWTYTSEFEARVAETVLADAGIESLVRKDDEGGFNPGLAFTRGVQLLVRTEDAVAARDILEVEDPGED
jgi:hypothetical protein